MLQVHVWTKASPFTEELVELMCETGDFDREFNNNIGAILRSHEEMEENLLATYAKYAGRRDGKGA